MHVVLDHEDPDAELVSQAADQLGDLVRLVGVHAGGGLVEQQQAGLCGERARDLEAAAVCVGEAVGRLVPAVAGQPLTEEPQHVLGELSNLAFLAAGARQERKIDSAGVALVAP